MCSTLYKRIGITDKQFKEVEDELYDVIVHTMNLGAVSASDIDLPYTNKVTEIHIKFNEPWKDGGDIIVEKSLSDTSDIWIVFGNEYIASSHAEDGITGYEVCN